MPSSNDGIDGRLHWIEAGIARTREGNRGSGSCRVATKLVLGTDEAAAGMSLDRNEEPAGAIRSDGAANAMLAEGLVSLRFPDL